MDKHIQTDQPISSLPQNEEELSNIKDKDVYLKKYIEFKNSYSYLI